MNDKFEMYHGHKANKQKSNVGATLDRMQLFLGFKSLVISLCKLKTQKCLEQKLVKKLNQVTF